jgi:hypothetical protein
MPDGPMVAGERLGQCGAGRHQNGDVVLTLFPTDVTRLPGGMLLVRPAAAALAATLSGTWI